MRTSSGDSPNVSQKRWARLVSARCWASEHTWVRPRSDPFEPFMSRFPYPHSMAPLSPLCPLSCSPCDAFVTDLASHFRTKSLTARRSAWSSFWTLLMKSLLRAAAVKMNLHEYVWPAPPPRPESRRTSPPQFSSWRGRA